MSIRIILATVFLSVAGLLGGCAAESSSEAPATNPTETVENEKAIVGDWSDTEVDWTVHFKADGTFVEDFQGNAEMRSGTWTVENGIVTLEGGDGNSNQGTYDGTTIEFRLGTLTKVS